MDPKLRAALEREAARKKPPQSLSREIEDRLRKSLDGDLQRNGKLVVSQFGGKETLGLALLLTEIIRKIELATNKVEAKNGKLERVTDRRWFNDPYTAQQVKLGVAEILNEFCARGEATPPGGLGFWDKHPEQLGWAVVGGIVPSVRGAPEEGPFDAQSDDGSELVFSNELKLHARIKRLLGAVAKPEGRG